MSRIAHAVVRPWDPKFHKRTLVGAAALYSEALGGTQLEEAQILSQVGLDTLILCGTFVAGLRSHHGSTLYQ
jgi:hypothetical protein